MRPGTVPNQNPSWTCKPPKPALLHVGQMIARKGIAEFLHAAARVQQEGLTFSIVLVGGAAIAPSCSGSPLSFFLDNVRSLSRPAAECDAGYLPQRGCTDLSDDDGCMGTGGQ